jgi:hypothetical protein
MYMNKLNIIVINIDIIKAKITSPNMTVYAAPAVGGLGFRSARSFRCAPFPRLTPAQFAPKLGRK